MPGMMERASRLIEFCAANWRKGESFHYEKLPTTVSYSVLYRKQVCECGLTAFAAAALC